MSDESDPVQPDGQGGESTSDAPYAEYLDRLPEEVRGDVEPVFRDWDANTTRKFQEASEYRKAWEPFEQLGVNQRDPQLVEWALQLADAAQNDPAAMQQWFQQYAQERGLTVAQAEQQLEQDYIDPATQQLVEQQLAARLGPVARQLEELSEWRSTQEQQRAEAEAMSGIRTELDSLKEKHPDEYNEQMVEVFVSRYIESDPTHAVQRGFQDWQKARNDLEKQFLQGKADVPVAAESGGGVNAGGEVDNSLKAASARAMEQLLAAKRQ